MQLYNDLNLVTNQLCPIYEGQLIFMAETIPYPKRPRRTLSRRSSFFATDGRAGTDSSILRYAETIAHHFTAICGGGVVYAVGPVRPSHSGPPT